MRPLASDRGYFVTRCAERSMPGRNPGKRNILYLNQCWRRQYFGNLVRFVPSTNKPRHPYLSVRVIRVSFAIPTIQRGTDPSHLINARDHPCLVEIADQLVALFINVWCDLMSNLAGIAAQCDPLVESCRSKPDGTCIGSVGKDQPEPDMLPAIGAHSVWLFKRQVLMPPFEEEWADRRVLVGSVK